MTLNAVGVLVWMYQSGHNGFMRDFARAMAAAIGQNVGGGNLREIQIIIIFPSFRNSQSQPRCKVRAKITALVMAALFFFANALWALLRLMQIGLELEKETEGRQGQQLFNGANNNNGGTVLFIADTNGCELWVVFAGSKLL